MDGYVTIGTKLETKTIDKQIMLLEDKLEGLVEEYEALEKATPFERQTDELIKLGNEIDSTRKKITKLKKQQQAIDFSNMNNGIEKVTRRIGKMALAVFGIRSAFMFVRSAINTIAGDDEQLKTDIEYMKSALAYTLEPLVRGIVNLAKQLMFYIGYIVKAWTGKNIFENANKSLKKTNGQVSKLQKTLASFDELNIVNDNSQNGGSGATTPNFDLSNPDDVDAPRWVKFIAKNKKGILAVIGGVASGLVAIKLGLKGIKALGIGIAITGVIYAIEKLIDFIKDPSFDNFIGVLKGIALAVTGVAIAVGAWPVAVAGALALAIIEIIKHFDKIKEWFGKLKVWLDENFLGGLKKIFGPFAHIIYAPFENAYNWIMTIFDSLFGGIKKIVEGIVKIFNGDFKGGLSDIFSGLYDILSLPFRLLETTIKTIVATIKKTWQAFYDWFAQKDAWFNKKASGQGYGGGFSGGGGHSGGGGSGGGFAKGGIIYHKLPKLATGGIINMPGRGVPLAGSIGGERGMEGVIPLTDSQQMMLLGEAIGRYITINATMINQMNGRVISRELQKVQNDSDFAFNR